jgi:hypothetical protein
MPITPLSNVLQFPEGERGDLPPELEVDLDTGEDVSFEDGAKKIELPDGSLEIDLAPKPDSGEGPKGFYDNLAKHMDEAELNRISSELLEGIERDNQSRQEHLTMIAEGMKLLGLVIESPNASQAQSSAPLEGMSTVRHPLLLEACQLFQANAMGELLPAAGPVKVRDDRPQKPPQPELMGHNGGPPLNDSPFAQPPVSNAPPHAPMPPGPQAGPPPVVPMGAPPMGAPAGPAAAPPGAPPQPVPPPAPAIAVAEEPRDELADALERDMNHYLTVVAKEYVPDTDQMLFKVGFGGLGIKKVYNCPLKRRPVSISVDIDDFIVSNALTDLSNAGRITHRIKMRPSVLKRMQILGQYRDVPIGIPTGQSNSPNQVEQAKAEVAGVDASPSDPRDADHEIFECYCELDLDEFAPEKFKGKGLALPYRVTIEKDSEKVLEVRRNWKEDDEECLAREYFVDFPYMRAFGFYCIGLLHLLGNTTKALTALWREFIDAGMFANFPGFLYLKGAGRQLTNQFRVAPGSGVGLDANVLDIRSAVMPLPYKSPDAGFVQFVTHVEELGQRLGGTANTNVGEGRADAPVGTTLALIEQATKPVSAVNKRLHAAQQKEFLLLKERFKEDPEAFWRFNKRPTMPWQKEQFVAALNDYDLIPVSDPNNPTRMHRMGKAEGYKQLVAGAPQLFDLKKATLHYARQMELGDVESTMLKPEQIAQASQQQQPQIDPAKMAAAQGQAQKAQLDYQAKLVTAQANVTEQKMEMQDAAEERSSRERVAWLNLQSERLKLAQSLAIHGDARDEKREDLIMKILADKEERERDRQHELTKEELAHQRQQQPVMQQLQEGEQQ